jgi:hypothetical protein
MGAAQRFGALSENGRHAMTAFCIDCGMDTAPDDDRRRRGARPWEWYMVHDRVWCAAGMPKCEVIKHNASHRDILCIGCLEARLGRRLTPRDFINASINRPDRWNSPRLNARLIGDVGASKPDKETNHDSNRRHRDY